MTRTFRSVFCVALLLAVAASGREASAECYQGPYHYGRVIESAAMPSKVLGQDVLYTVYLPPDYDSSRREYPVLYLLHGQAGSDSVWMHYGEINRIMDKGIAEGRFTPMIVVMPDGRRNEANAVSTYFMDDADGTFRWEEMFNSEFIPFFEKEYRVRNVAPFRAVGGLSMGGYGALMLALQDPAKYSAVVALSAALFTADQIREQDQKAFDIRYGSAYGSAGKAGADRLTDLFRKKHPLETMKTANIEALKKIDYFIDCGAEDGLNLDIGNFELHRYFKEKGVKHTFLIRTGVHNWKYWREGIDLGLEFVTSVFHR